MSNSTKKKATIKKKKATKTTKRTYTAAFKLKVVSYINDNPNTPVKDVLSKFELPSTSGSTVKRWVSELSKTIEKETEEKPASQSSIEDRKTDEVQTTKAESTETSKKPSAVKTKISAHSTDILTRMNAAIDQLGLLK